MSDQGDGFQVSQKEKNKNQVAHGKVCREHRQQDEHWEVAIISSHFNVCIKQKTILKELMVFVTLLVLGLNKTKWGWRATDEHSRRETKEFGTKRLMISRDDKNGWKRVSVCNKPNI